MTRDSVRVGADQATTGTAQSFCSASPSPSPYLHRVPGERALVPLVDLVGPPEAWPAFVTAWVCCADGFPCQSCGSTWPAFVPGLVGACSHPGLTRTQPQGGPTREPPLGPTRLLPYNSFHTLAASTQMPFRRPPAACY